MSFASAMSYSSSLYASPGRSICSANHPKLGPKTEYAKEMNVYSSCMFFQDFNYCVKPCHGKLDPALVTPYASSWPTSCPYEIADQNMCPDYRIHPAELKDPNRIPKAK